MCVRDGEGDIKVCMGWGMVPGACMWRLRGCMLTSACRQTDDGWCTRHDLHAVP